MILRRFLPLAALLCAACSPISYEEESPALTPDPSTVMGLDVPDNPPIREPYTTTLEVRDKDKNRYGYLIRYDAPPMHASDLERKFQTGTVIVDDRQFAQIGFITPLGHAFRFTRTDPEDLGQGSLDVVLPRFFGKSGLSVVAIH